MMIIQFSNEDVEKIKKIGFDTKQIEDLSIQLQEEYEEYVLWIDFANEIPNMPVLSKRQFIDIFIDELVDW